MVFFCKNDFFCFWESVYLFGVVPPLQSVLQLTLISLRFSAPQTISIFCPTVSTVVIKRKHQLLLGVLKTEAFDSM